MGVYNSISNVRRIAFIDGLTDAKAKTLSMQYPFAICYASEGQNSENNHWIPGFWKDGKRYGVQYIDENPITLNGFSIKLSYDEQSGILRLISSESSIPVTRIAIIPDRLELDINDLRYYQLSVSFIPSNTTDKSITWSSSNSSKVSVSESGFIIANPETCTNPVEEITIKATSTSDSSIYGTCIVTVVNNAMTDLLYYIGTDQFVQGSSININNSDLAVSVGSSGWHKLSSQTISNNFYTYENGGYTDDNYNVVVIPAEYSFGLPLFNESNKRYEDIGFINSASSKYNIKVNKKSYTVYKFNTEISKFINSILPKNQLLDPTQ